MKTTAISSPRSQAHEIFAYDEYDDDNADTCDPFGIEGAQAEYDREVRDMKKSATSLQPPPHPTAILTCLEGGEAVSPTVCARTMSDGIFSSAITVSKPFWSPNGVGDQSGLVCHEPGLRWCMRVTL